MTSQKFVGKVAIVTGSSSGIGQGIALVLAQQGAAVTIHGRSLEGIQETEKLLLENGVDSSKILLVQGDIEDPKTAEKLIEETLAKFKQIDVLVNNAGVGSKPSVDPNSDENLDFVFDVNLKSVIRLNRLVTPHLVETRGNIVNISSIDAMKAHSEYSYYALTKASLDHYMRHAAPPLGKQGIRMNNVNPGLVKTNLVKRMGVDDGAFDAMVKEFVENDVPLQRVGTPEDIAHAVSFLASSEASYVTGTTLVVDGGALGNFKTA